jgi:hypothetical protein
MTTDSEPTATSTVVVSDFNFRPVEWSGTAKHSGSEPGAGQPVTFWVITRRGDRGCSDAIDNPPSNSLNETSRHVAVAASRDASAGDRTRACNSSRLDRLSAGRNRHGL